MGMCVWAAVDSKGPDLTVHMHSLIRAFASHIHSFDTAECISGSDPEDAQDGLYLHTSQFSLDVAHIFLVC